MEDSTIVGLVGFILLILMVTPFIILSNIQYTKMQVMCDDLGYQEARILDEHYYCVNVSYDQVTGEEHMITFKPDLDKYKENLK